jgi:hypothetical protein
MRSSAKADERPIIGTNSALRRAERRAGYAALHYVDTVKSGRDSDSDGAWDALVEATTELEEENAKAQVEKSTTREESRAEWRRLRGTHG